MKQTTKVIQGIGIEITADKILFFDMDGTLIDTNLANFLSYKKAIQSVIKYDHNLNYNPNKRFNRSILKNAIPNLNDEEYKTIIRKKEEYYKDFLPEAQLIKVIADILLKYWKINKTVLVTNCRENRALETLNHFKLYDKFSHIFYRHAAVEEKKINKFQNAISKLGLSPNSVIAFENEEIEILDAMQAGIRTINPEIHSK